MKLPLAVDNWLRVLLLGTTFSLPCNSYGQEADSSIDWAQSLESDKADYQATLNAEGLDSKSQLVRLGNICLLATACRDFDTLKHYSKRLVLHSRAIFGSPSVQLRDAEMKMAIANEVAKLSSEQQAMLAEAAQRYLQIDAFLEQQQPERAIHELMLAINLRRNVLGNAHAEVTSTVLDLALLIESQAPDLDPLPHGLSALPHLLDSEPDYFQGKLDFAAFFFRQADRSNAEKLLRDAEADLRKNSQAKSDIMATVLVNLGTLLYETGDYAGAQEHLYEAYKIFEQSLLSSAKETSDCQHTLALVLLETGEYDLSKRFFEASLQLDESLLGREEPDFWRAQMQFAWLLYKRQEYAESEQLARQGLEFFRDQPTVDPLANALGFTLVGKATQAQKKFLEAEGHFRSALAMMNATQDSAKLQSYRGVMNNNLAKCLQMQGKYAEAVALYQEALGFTRREFNQSAIFQSERQQIAHSSSLKYQLDNLIDCVLAAGPDAGSSMVMAAYEQALQWKGSVLVRQQKIREGATSETELRLFEELQLATMNLSKLSNSMPLEPEAIEAWRNDVQLANEKKEALQRNLASQTARFLDANASPWSYDRFRRSLPNDIVLIDYFQTGGSRPRLIVFLIHGQFDPRMIDLGPTDEIEIATDRWRTQIQNRQPGTTEATKVKDLIWAPMERWLPDDKILLVSTDGVLGRVPLAALPGTDAKRFLIEEQRMAMLPVPQLLPALLQKLPRDTAVEPFLLTVGDAQYDAHVPPDVSGPEADPSSKANSSRAFLERARGTRKFGPLQETGQEIATIEQIFERTFEMQAGNAKQLVKDAATEANFRSLAPQVTHIHLATHGFFADEQNLPAELTVTSETELPKTARSWRGLPTGLLSGLALAGANQPWISNAIDDGILTADEISSMSLNRVQLVVLSACETGLGRTAGGEGILGIQRAFQVSGAASSIASLWSVSDLETRLLMEEFYRNLWERKMNRLDALREAQLMLLKGGRSNLNSTNRAGIIDLPNAIVREAPKPTADADGSRLHPYFWAAFNLAGDWR
jgi:CHAT domain-containing protein